MRKFFILSICALFLLTTSGFSQELNIGQELKKAKSKRTVGLVLMIGGGVILAGSTYLIFADKEVILRLSPGLFPILNTYKEIKTIYIVSGAIGLATGVAGLATHLSARKKIKRLKGEAVAEIGILPEFNAVGVRLRISF